jgi:hypothetical protein
MLIEKIKEQLKENRPNMTESTMKTYLSLLKSLYGKLQDDKNKNDDVGFYLNNKQEILQYIESLQSDQSKKTILSALYVLTNDQEYNDIMRQYCKRVNDTYSKKEFKEERLKNLPTQQDLDDIYNKVLKGIKQYPLSFDHWVQYLIVCVSNGMYINPRRLKDWTEMKLNNYDVNCDNYILVENKKWYFVFNQFKTAKYTKEEDKKVLIPNELVKIIKQWKKINDKDYFIFQKNGQKFTSSSLSKYFNNIYGDYIGADTLRSIFATNKLGKLINEKQQLEEQLNEEATKMGTSINALQTFYNKKKE